MIAAQMGVDYGPIRRSAVSHKVNVELLCRAMPTGQCMSGHCRGPLLVMRWPNLMAFCGLRLTKEYYINDAGRISMSCRNRPICAPRSAGRRPSARSPVRLYPAIYLFPVGARRGQGLPARQLEGDAGRWTRMAFGSRRQPSMRWIGDESAMISRRSCRARWCSISSEPACRSASGRFRNGLQRSLTFQGPCLQWASCRRPRARRRRTGKTRGRPTGFLDRIGDDHVTPLIKVPTARLTPYFPPPDVAYFQRQVRTRHSPR